MLAGFGIDALKESSTFGTKKALLTLGMVAAGAFAVESIASRTTDIPDACKSQAAPTNAYLLYLIVPMVVALVIISTVWRPRLSTYAFYFRSLRSPIRSVGIRK